MTGTSSKRLALIIGGSLGGMFTATALRAIGWDVKIFERSPSALDSRGGGIVLQPDVLATLRFSGLQHSNALGVASGDRIYLDRNDEVIHRLFVPQTQTSWNVLYGLMSRAIPPDVVSTGETFIGFEQDEECVTAHFESGRVEAGDLLIGADGPHSSLRKLLIPDSAPHYAGYVAWRGLVPERVLSKKATDKLAGAFAFQQGTDTFFLEYLVPGEDGSTAIGERRWNWVWYRRAREGPEFDALMTDREGCRHRFSMPPGAVSPDQRDTLFSFACRDLAPSFSELVQATEEPFVQAILDLQVSQMLFGRTLLIGDAAFIPRPHTAGSTAKAAADARVLAEALRSSTSMDEALRTWQSSRMQEGLMMTHRGIAVGNRLLGLGRTD